MKSIREVLRLYLLANLSARKIQGATGVARTTVQEYIKQKLNLDENEIKICNYFDIEEIQKTRDQGDGEYHIFAAKDDENETEDLL